MSEKNDFNILRKHLPQGKDRLERIENMAGTGTPDINFCSEGVECWIEMKSSTEPKRKTSALLLSNHKLSQTQKNWFLRQRRAGGKAYILIVTDKRWMLIDGTHADEINELTVNRLLRIATWESSQRPVSKLGWGVLRSILNLAHLR